jgi:molecular chaperone HtpG
MQKGNISVQAENIFPIIKKFLYSDHEIFLRELVSNAIDASSKLKTLSSRGEFTGELGDLTIEIIADKENKTLTIRDKGIGMTDEEVKKYLNQVAFSSAKEFLEKYKDDSTIIGNFGLGFFSSFMVAGKVEVRSRSWQEDAEAVVWTCEGNPEYTLDTIEKEERGTDVILHINEEDEEFLEDQRIEELLRKYCRFLPFPIQFGTRTETHYEGEGEDKEEIKEEVPNIINNTHPLWKKSPSDLTDEDYKEFYRELYPFSSEPLFWIHLNIDYPFHLTGVLYFPRIGNNIEIQKNKIQLYSNQVYVTDDVSQIVPEFLTLLHGVIDSPDIPLNVSRSYLQGDRNVKKITGYITKKVADKLDELFRNNREDFESKWSDLNVFVKYGMISEDSFYEKAQKFALLKNVDGDFATIDEYKEKVKPAQTDKYDKIVLLYTNNADEHHSLIDLAKARNYDVLLFDNIIDNHFLQQLEYKLGDVTFVRVDSDTIDNLIQKDEEKESVLSEKDQEKVKELFTKEITDVGANVELKPLSPDDHPVTITRPEFMRRMKEMQMLQGQQMEGLPDSYNVVINSNHPLITEKLLRMRSEEKKENFVRYLYNLARLNQNMLKGADLTAFVQKSVDLLSGK